MNREAQQSAATPARDSIFGVCAAVAGDFGFNPLWLRLAIGAALMWNLEVALGSYAALGVIVLISRLVAPNPRVRTSQAAMPTPLAVETQQNNEPIDLPRAA
jgi:phage shock protein PspC (stress-responsive transcriptional regulator)